MNKKGFTLIELLAVLVILSIISVVAIPMVMQHPNNAKNTTYVTNAKAFITSATYMYTLDRYSSDDSYFIKNDDGSYTITLNNVYDLSINKDPFDYEYQKDISYVTFKDPDENSINSTRKITVFIKSCDPEDSSKCHCISGDASTLSEKDVDNDCLTK